MNTPDKAALRADIIAARRWHHAAIGRLDVAWLRLRLALAARDHNQHAGLVRAARHALAAELARPLDEENPYGR